jgi:hypothetical protein
MTEGREELLRGIPYPVHIAQSLQETRLRPGLMSGAVYVGCTGDLILSTEANF